MEKLRARFNVSFRAKVLVPVMAAMGLLLAASMWLVNQRVTGQLQAEAAQQLITAETVLKKLQNIHSDDLLWRYRNIVNEPRVKTVSRLDDRETFRRLLDDLIGENVADVIVLGETNLARALAVAGDQRVNVEEFEAASAGFISQAINGQPKVGTTKNGDRLFDIVAIPIRIGLGDTVVGTMTFGIENSVAREFRQLTQSELVFLSEGRVVASSLRKSDLPPLLDAYIDRRPGKHGNPIERRVLNNEHFLCLAGSLNAPGEPNPVNYLILSSYENPLQALRTTQQLLLLISSLAILLGTGVVWWVVRKVTRPLRELRDSAEAVGRGDFSRRVQVRSDDECGELAHVFNQMTESLQNSREQLEMTVERLKTTQAQLIQSEKLSGIGEFVAGVAHELNNPLTSVMGFSELLAQADADPQHRRYLEMILKSAQRCHKIVQSLLSFARRHVPERKPVCVNSLLDAALEILQYQLRTSNIEATTHFDANLPQAMVDPHQIQQVFLNIINNARQAIETHQPKGWIRITTAIRGSNVQVTIQDSGPGISEENLSKIFDPFFTTKEVGKGTGLGLSLCYGIIKEHGGTITPRSRPGEGATFIIELPITHKTGDTDASERVPETDVIDPHEGQGKHVLVIDDEEPILHMVREALSCRGYHVDTAQDGETGLRHLRKTHYDVTLCDWKMPGLNGRQVYERLRAKNPALSDCMIFITGDMLCEQTRQFLDEHKRICLPKPFTLADFRAAIKTVLAKAAS